MRCFIRSLKKNLRAEHILALEACLDCRHCGTACAWHLGTADPKLHPNYKKDFIYSIYHRFLTLEGRLLGWLGLIPTPTVSDLRRRQEYYWKCTMCGRCTLACPLSLNNRSVVRLAREAYADSGLNWENPTLAAVRNNFRDVRHSFGLNREQVVLRNAYLLSLDQTEAPVDLPGAEYLFVCAAVGNTQFPDYGSKVPKLLNAAGVHYTLSSRITDTGTDAEYIIAHRELAARLLMDLEDEAERLQVEKILISECGCDVRTFHVEAKNLLGRELKFPVQTLDALLLDRIRTRQLLVKPLKETITLHDSCYVTRLSGLGDMERRLLDAVADHAVEMNPNREYNYCCNGGVGPLRLPENTELRRKVSVLKANQIRAAGASRVVTPCAVCMLSLEDTCLTYGLTSTGQRMVFMMFEVVFEAVYRALDQQGELWRLKVPAAFRGRSAESIHPYSIANTLEKFAARLEHAALQHWLAGDAIVKRYQAALAAGMTQPKMPILDETIVRDSRKGVQVQGS